MAEEFTHLINSIGGLRLANRTSDLSRSGFNGPNPNQITLEESIRRLIQSAEATATHAQQVESSDIAQLSSLRRTVNDLARVTETFNDATERYIVAYITSLAGPKILMQNMLSHFNEELTSIVLDVLNSTGDNSNVLREILEMCYYQAINTSGTLHSDNYFIPLGEARSGWPYDHEFESEAYYDHINRLDIDNSYIEAFRVRCERESEKERKQKEEWIRFWVQGLSECPDGPTLFYPPASHLPQCRLSHVPQYLFRAFDQTSTGRNDHNVVASKESISTESRRSRVDLLSRTGEEAARMLHKHLTKPCFEWNNEGEDVDNLMSWSSSLLFVIQYAIWRCHKLHSTPAEVEICMVDTTEFPHGQFARDMSLIRAYHEAPELEKEIRQFFDFRLKNKYYDNGEYLSQGVLHHTGRSVVVSLSQLIDAGLYELYPEFADSAETGLWTKRVGALRSEWTTEHTTTKRDIQRASDIATACFHRFNTPDVALLLLSFKERKLRTSTTTVLERRDDSNDFGPDEVQRYIKITETMKPKWRDGRNSSSLLSLYHTLLVE